MFPVAATVVTPYQTVVQVGCACKMSSATPDRVLTCGTRSLERHLMSASRSPTTVKTGTGSPITSVKTRVKLRLTACSGLRRSKVDEETSVRVAIWVTVKTCPTLESQLPPGIFKVTLIYTRLTSGLCHSDKVLLLEIHKGTLNVTMSTVNLGVSFLFLSGTLCMTVLLSCHSILVLKHPPLCTSPLPNWCPDGLSTTLQSY